MSQSHLPAVLAVSPGESGTSREYDLLCACAAVELSPERAASIADWNRSSVDWDQFFRLAEHHGILPLAARNLGAHAQGLPSLVEQKLRSAFDANLRRSLWFASEMVRIQDHFVKIGLRAVPYKGPTLAEAAYGDVALRSFSDLDFLISPTDYGRFKAALEGLGYQPSADLTPALERYWLRKGYERSFDSAAGKHLVELQWGLVPYLYAVDLSTEDLLARARPMSLGGCEVSGLSPEDLLLVLCLHAAKHLWMRLIWVCDIAETLRTQAIDWDLLRKRAREVGLLRILGVSFWLAERLLSANLPNVAQQIVSQDSEVSVLGEMFGARLARSASYDFETTEYFRLVMRLRERLIDQARYLWRLLWTPGESDLVAFQLPEALFPLYRAVRVARLIRKLF